MEKLTVASIAIRNRIGQPKESIHDMQDWTGKACDAGAELILFPELNVSGYIPSPVARDIAEPVPGPSTDQIIKIAQRYNAILGYGLIEQEQDSLFCTHVLVNGAGVIGKQRKIHVPTQERPYWEPGDAIQVIDIGKARVGITICRDAFFDEMTRTLYFKGAEIVLMPFGYYNVPRSRYLKGSIHGMSIIKASWANGFYSVVCNSAETRVPNAWEPQGRMFPGWAGIISPWGNVIRFVEEEGNSEAMVIAELSPEELADRRSHPNFLANELRNDLYKFEPCR